MKKIFGLVATLAMLALAACNNPAAPQGNYGNIAGTVTSASGQPLAGVVIQVDAVMRSQPTGPDGKYTVQGVPVTNPGAPALVEVVTVPAGYQRPPARTDVQVQAGQTTSGIDFRLAPS